MDQRHRFVALFPDAIPSRLSRGRGTESKSSLAMSCPFSEMAPDGAAPGAWPEGSGGPPPGQEEVGDGEGHFRPEDETFGACRAGEATDPGEGQAGEPAGSSDVA